MSGPKRLSWLVRVGAVVAVVGLVGVGCSNAKDKGSGSSGSSASTVSGGSGGGGGSASGPGVTGSEIRFSAIGTRTNNPLGTCVLDCFADGVRAYFGYRNSQGGLFGRRLVLSKVLDDQLGQNQVRALEVVTANDTFATFDASQLANGYATLAKAGVPLYTWTISPAEMNGKDSIYGNREPICITCTKRSDAYVAHLAGAKRVATLGYGVSDNSKQCAQSGAAAIKKYGRDVGGISLAYTDDHLDFGLPNGIGPEVTAMKQAGVDFITGCIDLNGMKTLAQEMKRQGLNATLYHTNTYDQDFVRKNASLFNGGYVQVSFRPFEAGSTPAIAAYKAWMKKDGAAITELAMDGWINADLAYQGIKAAGPGFTRQKVIDATNKMTAFTAGGLTQPIDWSRQHVSPTEADPATHGPAQDCVAVVKIEGGVFHPVGDPAKPFICWPGNTRAWSQPKNIDFK